MCAINPQEEHSKPKSAEKPSEKYTRPLLAEVIVEWSPRKAFYFMKRSGTELLSPFDVIYYFKNCLPQTLEKI